RRECSRRLFHFSSLSFHASFRLSGARRRAREVAGVVERCHAVSSLRPRVRDLLLCAKHLFVAAKPCGCGPLPSPESTDRRQRARVLDRTECGGRWVLMGDGGGFGSRPCGPSAARAASRGPSVISVSS